MAYQNLSIQEENGILILTISREKAMNALNDQTIVELRQFFASDAPARTEIQGIILTGAGPKAFVAGADIKEFIELNAEKGRQLSKRGQDVFRMIETFPKPVIAAVNGFALGGGCELAMACHLRIAAENARFGQPEVNLGIIPGYGGTQRLIQYIGKGKAMELLLTGDMIDAASAYQLGLVNQVVPAEELLDKAKAMLRKIATKGPIAVAKVISSVNAYFQYNEDGFDHEMQAFGATTGTEDFKEGAAAFVEKRQAKFRGK
jgi:enoyl-CoA hydratase